MKIALSDHVYSQFESLVAALPEAATGHFHDSCRACDISAIDQFRDLLDDPTGSLLQWRQPGVQCLLDYVTDISSPEADPSEVFIANVIHLVTSEVVREYTERPIASLRHCIARTHLLAPSVIRNGVAIFGAITLNLSDEDLDEWIRTRNLLACYMHMVAIMRDGVLVAGGIEGWKRDVEEMKSDVLNATTMQVIELSLQRLLSRRLEA